MPETRVLPSKFEHASYRIEVFPEVYGWPSSVRVPSTLEDATVVSSEITEPGLAGMHSVMLDIDLPAALIPSSTEGNFHLYIDKPMTWRQYKRVLRVLASVGVIEKGYRKASLRRRATFLRPPWVKKATQ